MDHLLSAVLLATFAGVTIPLGAALATKASFQSHWLDQEFRHSVVAFGGGALFAAVALVLVPEGAERLSAGWAALAFTSGGLAFFLLDRMIAKSGGGSAQLFAMMLDYVPEAIALGASLAVGGSAGYLLALLIALQNLPEGFNAYREMIAKGTHKPRNLLLAFSCLPLVGAVSAWLGHEYAAGQPELLGALMLFAASGIIYLLFEDIAPQVRLERQWAPPLGAVAGFQLGLLGDMLIS
ncbi:divalent cation transporter [Lentibacter algarum]|uniref:ZIP family metal transporter n=1 Tax=Lentibacter algarum TaxID=576131 RepID=UPI001C06A9DC|nr:divalent cation transporter [Lentibacter algarum]MBU2980353.1 divalent cation transporter [Lentibacter algarum]